MTLGLANCSNHRYICLWFQRPANYLNHLSITINYLKHIHLGLHFLLLATYNLQLTI